MVRFNKSAAQADFLESLKASFNNNSSSSDLLIICNGRVFDCDKQILIRRSKWFEKACRGKFTESGASEIELHEEEDHEVIRAMLDFCYGFEYNGPDSQLPSAEMAFHIAVFAAGDKYFVKGLCDLATDRFVQAARNASIETLAGAISNIYHEVADPDKILRSAVVELILDEGEHVLDGRNAIFNDLIAHTGSFAADLVPALARLRAADNDAEHGPVQYYMFPTVQHVEDPGWMIASNAQ